MVHEFGKHVSSVEIHKVPFTGTADVSRRISARHEITFIRKIILHVFITRFLNKCIQFTFLVINSYFTVVGGL